MTTSQNPERVPPIENWNRLLEGKVALVTGGGAGIGGAISRLFALHGAHVEIAEIDPERAGQAVSDIEAAGGSARAHIVDITSTSDIARLKDAVLAEHPYVSVLVNNVGDYRPRVEFLESDADQWDQMYRKNFFHVVAVTRAFTAQMIAGGGGSIVNFHSVEGLRGYPGAPVYAAMKAATAKFSTDTAVLLGRHGIRVNGIGTDLTQTPQVDYITAAKGQDHLWESWAPVGRLGWPEDQARVALFLASDMSAYVTGHNVPVDGGTKAGGGWYWSAREGRFVNMPMGI